MRVAVAIGCALLLLLASASAQSLPPGAFYYINTEYRFAAIFPEGAAPVATDITYTNHSGDRFPARRFSVAQGDNLHTVTVVDVSSGADVDLNLVEHATEELRGKGEVRFQEYDVYDPNVPGRQLNIFEPDGRQLRASVYMWDHRLYITEANGAPGAISLLQFEQSITLLNADGTTVNY